MVWTNKVLWSDLWQGHNRLALGPIQPPVQWVPRTVFTGMRWTGHKADHMTISGTQVKNGGAIPPLPISPHGKLLN
jgi:hypothetical protein